MGQPLYEIEGTSEAIAGRGARRARHRIHWIGTALLWALCLLAVGSPAAQAQTRFITEYQQDRDITEVPFEYKNRQIVIHGTADDKTDLTFLFDTGASAPVLDKSLGLTGTHIRDTIIQEAEGQSAAEAIWLGKLTLGETGSSALIYNVETLLTDLSQMSKLLGQRIDGIIGITCMAGYVVEIDYDKKVLRFHSPRRLSVADRKPDNKRTFLMNLSPITPTRATPCLLLTGKLHPKYDYNFLLDTGYGGYLSVAQSSAMESGLMKSDTPRVTHMSYSISRRFVSHKIRAAYLMLGEVNVSGRIISVDVRNDDAYGQGGILGNRFLQNYRVFLDYPRRKLWLERVVEKEDADEAEKPSLGIALRADGSSIKVERVTKNSPAQRSGVRPGDTILSVNGQSLETLNLSQAVGLLASPKGATTLALLRGVDPNLGTRSGKPLTLTLEPSSPLDWKAE